MRFTYKALAGFLLLFGLSLWLARTYSAWWYLFTFSCCINGLRQAAYATPTTQPPPKSPYDWLGFALHKILYPIALPYARLEFRMGEAFWAQRQRKAPDSLFAATAHASAEKRLQRAAVLGLPRASIATEAPTTAPSEIISINDDVFRDRDQISRTWPFMSAIYRLCYPFVIGVVTLAYRINGEDPTRRGLFCDPVPFWFDVDDQSIDLATDASALEQKDTTYTGWNPVLRDLQQLYCGNIILGRYDKAFGALQAAHRILGELRQDSLAGFGSRDEFLANSDFWVSAAFGLVPKYFVPALPEIMKMYEVLARAKAADIDILSVRRQVVGRAPIQTRELWKRIVPSLTERIAAATRAPADPGRRDTRSFKIRTRDRFAEMYLGMALSTGATSAQVDDIGWKQIVEALPPGAALLDIYKYAAIDMGRVEQEGIADYTEDRYFAFVLDADGMKYADLGAATKIDEIALSHLAEMSKAPGLRGGNGADSLAGGQPLASDQALSRLLIWPFHETLERATHIFISPDSTLAQVSFVSLAFENGVPLLERCPISYVESARQLAHLTVVPTAEVGPPVVIGSPSFDLGETGGFAWFDDLGGAEDEIIRVAKALRVPAITGASATERAFKEIRRPQILHVATHGFYMSRTGDGHEKGQIRPIANRWEALEALESPLLRSGLALAGVNSWLDGKPIRDELGDGILCAEDVLDMDLEGTELAVLSACETGIGEAVGGQGVFGLRRAFAIAGAKSLIVSLWKIPDESTVELMLAFYGYLAEGMNKAEALQCAQLDLRRSHPDPFEWAAFICLGSIAPIRGLHPAA